jgi:hypothetical protein
MKILVTGCEERPGSLLGPELLRKEHEVPPTRYETWEEPNRRYQYTHSCNRNGRLSGSLLAPELVRQGYEVIGLDTGFYKERAFYRDGGTTPLTLAKDLRHVGGGGPEGRGCRRSHGRTVQ